ncbi:MAG: hypothetical protein HY868_01590 [Chloroflexi bacterium]|nr:hypothetical protein [Chloroflexota bacterium]
MYVSMIHLRLSSHRIGEATRVWRESVLPELQEQPGWKDASFAVNHAADEVRVFTLWETEAQARRFEPCSCFRELAKLIALSCGNGERAIYRAGDEPAILEKLKPFLSLN